MQGNDWKIRVATVDDAKEIAAIYAPYVQQTAITFEYEVPTVEEFRRRIDNTLKKYPYLVAEQDGEIVGYAYASQFHPRAACQWDVETTVYIHTGQKRSGIGKALYAELEKILKMQHFLNMNASIACAEAADEHLTKDSIYFHEKMGYKKVGAFHNCGFKFGHWYHLMWMEKHIGEHTENPIPIRLFPEIEEEYKRNGN